jgi:hypothetical protein
VEARDRRPLNRQLVDPPAEQGEAAEGQATFPQPRDKPGVLVVDDNCETWHFCQ